jgi:hypothetical protein
VFHRPRVARWLDATDGAASDAARRTRVTRGAARHSALGSGDLTRAVRVAREVTQRRVSVSEIRSRIDRGDVVIVWKLGDGDVEHGDAVRRLVSMNRDIELLGRCGYTIARVVRTGPLGPWQEVTAFEAWLDPEQAASTGDSDSWPAWMSSAPPLSPSALQAEVAAAARAVWETIRREHVDETIYAYGLYPSEDDLAIQNACSTEEGMRRVAEAHAWMGGTAEERATALRWSSADWPYSCDIIAPFERVNEMLGHVRGAMSRHFPADLDVREHRIRWRRDAEPLGALVRAIYIGALAGLDHAGLFGRGTERSQIVLGVFGIDDDGAARSIDRLNSAEVVARWSAEAAESDRTSERLRRENPRAHPDRGRS